MRVSYVYRIDRESLTLTNQLRWIQLVVWVPKICEIVCGLLLMHWLYERSANERKLQLRIDRGWEKELIECGQTNTIKTVIGIHF